MESGSRPEPSFNDTAPSAGGAQPLTAVTLTADGGEAGSGTLRSGGAMRLAIGVLAVCTSLSAPAGAWDKEARSMPGNPGQSCAMQEQGQIGVSFNNVMVTDLKTLGAEMDRKIDEVIALGKQSGIQKIEVMSYNYNVYPVSGGYSTAPGVAIPYQYNGSVSFVIDPLAKGPDLMALLSGKGYSANLNVNAYRQCQ
jgi:hypothetical protein